MIQKDYKSFLPNVGVKYQLTDAQSVFVNAARNLLPQTRILFSQQAVELQAEEHAEQDGE